MARTLVPIRRYRRHSRAKGVAPAPWLMAMLAGLLLGLATRDIDLPSWLPAPAVPMPSIPAPSTDVGETISARSFALCHSGGGTNCVVDGDTFWLDGAKVRIADIDTPETHPPRCAAEAELGARATHRLRDLLSAGGFSLAAADRETDRYGRRLAVVTRGGQSIGQTLIDEGLARPWVGHRDPWC